MLQLSKFPFKTLKTVPGGSDNKGTGLLLQAGYIRQELAGAYNYLHYGVKTLEKIKQIVREELNSIGAIEILMSSFSPKESWLKTGRWDSVDVLFKVEGSGNKQYALNPTHEEVVTPLMQEFIQSYKDLDNCQVYQFQTKFRNETRAKSGVLRGREFIMKDLYSFHKNQEELDIYFEKAHGAYNRIFDRLGIGKDTLYTFASGGVFSKYSYEFQTILEIGEDNVYVCEKCGQAHNNEIVEETFKCVECGSNEYKIIKTSETGNIFKLSTKFSNAFGLKYADEKGIQNEIVMGCYGIGISRIMGVIAEKFADEKGLVWPENIAPFSHYLIIIGDNKQKALEFAKKLENEGKEVIIDDRDIGFGQKASDADLLGIPYRIVISDKTIEKGGYEIKARNSDEVKILTF
ncbi:MAG: His/Gly/Thr/Pro-type tRNA ligase C-terminal domain-containing protein [Candidatus Gracilibacteria bacterium]|nr:His/Gly/Thr/Pro-type tRNA ligase C-terminal domain-containing protein [Candidatus Gracilibacteria bacterium]MDD3119809.1 His/Gly/Thr/Pro-type tRNA ligase C-terminal domain-containing protein [Candidatus Gracilibacteria bacterium]MDD4530366.1 His/Gly/Thr/Pro-type tRNA ligase C-terminal domain-containing protein [Candidatus Gracilibacteria bacterium]